MSEMEQPPAPPAAPAEEAPEGGDVTSPPSNNVTKMEWKAKESYQPLAPDQLAQYFAFIKKEFMGLLRFPGSDEDHRKRLLAHEGIANFAKRHPIMFSKLTSREVVTNPRLLYPLELSVYLQKEVQAGNLDMERAKAIVSSAAMDALTREAASRGPSASPPTEEEER